MSRMQRASLIVAAMALSVLAAGCSTMDDVKVSHPCDGPVTVFINHLQTGSDGPPRYVAQTWTEVVATDEVSVVAGIVNLGANDLVRLVVDISGWDVEITRAQLRDRDGLITLPPEACPS